MFTLQSAPPHYARWIRTGIRFDVTVRLRSSRFCRLCDVTLKGIVRDVVIVGGRIDFKVKRIVKIFRRHQIVDAMRGEIVCNRIGG